MRFEDYARASDELRAQDAAEWANREGERVAREQLHGCARRSWSFALNQELHFHGEELTQYLLRGYDRGLALAASFHLTRKDWGLDIPSGLTVEGLLQMAEAVRHVEAWVHGYAAELLPSGPWASETYGVLHGRQVP